MGDRWDNDCNEDDDSSNEDDSNDDDSNDAKMIAWSSSYSRSDWVGTAPPW